MSKFAVVGRCTARARCRPRRPPAGVRRELPRPIHRLEDGSPLLRAAPGRRGGSANALARHDHRGPQLPGAPRDAGDGPLHQPGGQGRRRRRLRGAVLRHARRPRARGARDARVHGLRARGPPDGRRGLPRRRRGRGHLLRRDARPREARLGRVARLRLRPHDPRVRQHESERGRGRRGRARAARALRLHARRRAAAPAPARRRGHLQPPQGPRPHGRRGRGARGRPLRVHQRLAVHRPRPPRGPEPARGLRRELHRRRRQVPLRAALPGPHGRELQPEAQRRARLVLLPRHDRGRVPRLQGLRQEARRPALRLPHGLRRPPDDGCEPAAEVHRDPDHRVLRRKAHVLRHEAQQQRRARAPLAPPRRPRHRRQRRVDVGHLRRPPVRGLREGQPAEEVPRARARRRRHGLRVRRDPEVSRGQVRTQRRDDARHARGPASS